MKEKNKLLELKKMLDSEEIPYTYEYEDCIGKDGKVDFTTYSIWYPELPESLVHIHTSTKIADKGYWISYLRRKNELYDFLHTDQFSDRIFLITDSATAFEIIKKHHNKELED